MGNKQSGIIRDHPNSRNVTENCPEFGYPGSIQSALDTGSGGTVITGGACGGVALQRVHYLLTGRCATNQWRDVGKASGEALQFACIETDLIWHLKASGLKAVSCDRHSDDLTRCLSNGCVFLPNHHHFFFSSPHDHH
jgi:hypothetical protein